MDKITETKSESRLKQWTQAVSECRSSQKTAKAWCEENNVNVKSYNYWLRKIRTKACENINPPDCKPNQAIVPLKLSENRIAESPAAVTIKFHSAIVEISDGTSAETIGAVLAALKNIC